MKTIRPLALALIRRNDEYLLGECSDLQSGRLFYRPLGGGIEWGEQGMAAIQRELKEELDAELCAVRYAVTLENLFTVNGEMGHEIVLCFWAEFADAALYAQDILHGVESDGTSFRAVWRTLDFFSHKNAPPLYPDGLRNLLMTASCDQRSEGRL